MIKKLTKFLTTWLKVAPILVDILIIVMSAKVFYYYVFYDIQPTNMTLFAWVGLLSLHQQK